MRPITSTGNNSESVNVVEFFDYIMHVLRLTGQLFYTRSVLTSFAGMLTGD